MAWNQVADVEEGTTADFDSVTQNGSSTFTATAAAALSGSYGISVYIDASQSQTYGTLSGPAGETLITVQFMIDPNSLTMGDGESFRVVTANGTATLAAFACYLKYTTAGGYEIFSYVKLDDGTFQSSSTAITDAPHTVMMVWAAATAAGADDGYMQTYIDGEWVSSITGLDNDTKVVDEILYGAELSIDAGTTGTFYLDNCQWSSDLYAYPLSTATVISYAVAGPSILSITPGVASAITSVAGPSIFSIISPGAVSAVTSVDGPIARNTTPLTVPYSDRTLIPAESEIDFTNGSPTMDVPYLDFVLVVPEDD